MDIRQALIDEHSKAQVNRIIEYIGDDQERFDELIHIFLHDEWRITQRASWVLGHVAEQKPEMVAPHLQHLLENLQKEKIHVAVKRNTVRALQNYDIPEDLLGLAAEICFTYLDDPNEAIAVRAFSMPICYNICVKEPELANELKIVLETHIPYGSSGFKNRGKKYLKLLNKMLDEN